MFSRIFGVAMVCVFTLPYQVPAQDNTDSSCLTIAQSSIKSGQQVSVITTDQQKITGRLTRFDLKEYTLALALMDTSGLSEFTYRSGEIFQIQYRKAGKVRPLYPIVGFLAGSVIGLLAENHVIDPGYNYGFFEDDFTHRGSFWGGVGGLAAGTVISLLIPSTRTLNCK
jgi:hypothetical protein